MKLTPWFEGSVKPRRKGVYQQKCGMGWRIGYQYWNGKTWKCWSETPEGAMEEAGSRYNASTSDPWRGLAQQPKGKK